MILIETAPVFGEQLPNGATVIASRFNGYGQCYVLCKWHVNEFASWLLTKDGSTEIGHYYRNLPDAVRDWEQR